MTTIEHAENFIISIVSITKLHTICSRSIYCDFIALPICESYTNDWEYEIKTLRSST